VRGAPCVLVAGGHEPTGRAGLLADVAAVRALGARCVAVPTAQTAQGTTTFRCEPRPPRLVRAQVAAALELGPVHAVKLGMVPTRATLRALREGLAGLDAWWVVDPVVLTSRGERLSRLTPRDYLGLAGPRVVLTPNLPEAAWLLGWPEVDTPQAVEAAARALIAEGFGAVLIKGGHRARGATDVLCAEGHIHLLRGRRVARLPETYRGTGCRFASALAVELADGREFGPAARRAKALVARYLRGRTA
jgi:hydroxymethylpyrimidine/phosphomethylpyrimidine kinase